MGATSNTCTDCAAGTFSAVEGSSDCTPCAEDTYQDQTGQSSCSDCAAGSYSHLPGGTKCLMCVAGRPVECTTSCPSGTASDGYATAIVDTVNTLSGDACTTAGWPSTSTYPYPALTGTCSVTTSTLLSFYVKDTCEVVIQPLGDLTAVGDKACSDPSNAAATITAFYTSTTTISSKLSGATGTLITVDLDSGNAVTMSMLAATTDPNSQSLSASCSGSLTVSGGKVATAGPDTTCPAGTVLDNTDVSTSCTPCPAASYCATGTAANCPAGTYSAIVGLAAAGDCQGCASGT